MEPIEYIFLTSGESPEFGVFIEGESADRLPQAVIDILIERGIVGEKQEEVTDNGE